jgi:eukaryotic-like serine/threonine-protein kinase
MNEQKLQRVRALFAQAADLPREDRGAFLDDACGGEPELHAQIDRLLAFDSNFATGEHDEGFLNSPLVVGAEKTAYDESSQEGRKEPSLPSHIGRYRILRLHGEGGMGTVYEAEQDNPRRTVALKVIRSGFASRELVNRFQHEAQILARLQHPSIAQVHEAGMSEDGRLFFAMEFIRGMPLDEYARSHGLDARACLELVARVSDAVQHAHDKGVVHRDLKPGNILVEESGQPKVLDFGVAHVTAGDLLTISSQTPTGQLLGTLSYMSPEQLSAQPSGLDGRSDVYTLGVIFFELLAHRLPYRLEQLPVHEVARVIGQVEPSRLGSINKVYRGDVEIIVAKALEKDKTRRYASAKDLASDIRRYLRGEPILARQVGTMERTLRWARRNPSIAALAGVLAGVLVLGTVGSMLAAGRFARLAEREHKAATAERSARLEADGARKAAQAETYRAVLSEVKALRAGHQPGWREKSLRDLARLAIMPTPRRDLPELRTEAATSLGMPDIRHVATIDLPSDDLGSFTFSPDGRTLVTIGNKTGLDFWDVPGKRHLFSVEALTASGFDLDKALYLPDGQGLAVGTRDHGVVFTDTHGIRTARTPITQGTSKPIKLAVSANGQRIAVAWTDGAGITVHEAASGALLERFKGSSPPFALSPDGQWLARQENSEIVLLPIASGEPRIVLGRHVGAHAFAFSPDGAMLTAAFLDHTTVLWDVAKREQFGTLRGHRELVYDVAFSPDGEWIATGSLDYTVRIWEKRTGQNVATLSGLGPGRRVQWSPTGDHLATSTHGGRLVFLYLITGRNRVQQWLTSHRGEISCVAAHPRRERFTTSGGLELISWDLSVSRPTPPQNQAQSRRDHLHGSQP